jgi:hypothetical protein
MGTELGLHLWTRYRSIAVLKLMNNTIEDGFSLFLSGKDEECVVIEDEAEGGFLLSTA